MTTLTAKLDTLIAEIPGQELAPRHMAAYARYE